MCPCSQVSYLWHGELPWHCTRGSPQWSCSHSVHCLPPKPGRQWHWPVNCRGQRETNKLFVCVHFGISYFQAFSVPPHHVAVSSQGMMWVAATGFTASLLSVVPVVRSTLIAVMASHVLPTQAGSSLPVTVTLSITASRLDGASCHTGTA